ncbi:MAG: metalloregulator ArsR/SmtB family transcription factor [Treponema porcinum]|nr:metalloregulator ArsR/SmtB family transcription factor [Treponema porcinum]MDY5048664.1 metalloregulator ArsR/SmtB family transcription factor [Treponema porcinum]
MPDEDTLFDLAELFKIFGDSSRIKILFALFEKEMAVNELSAFLSMTQSAVSHQLRILKTNGLVKFRRDGKSLIYSLADGHVTSILSQGLDHIGE